MEKIYFDNAATTKVDERVIEVMIDCMRNNYGNPSSVHSFGRDARRLVEAARSQVAKLLNAESGEIFFTGGGTEADNLGIKGVMAANVKKGRHIISTPIEHHAVLHSLDYLKKTGCEVTMLTVDEYGMINPEELKNAIRPDTVLVSIMFANNEVGTVQPVAEIGAICRERGVYFHTDAVQAVGNVPIDVKALNIDLMPLSGHKFNASKGIGALYVRKGVRILPVQHGGSHERNLRAGTENVPGIVGLGKAAEIAAAEMNEKIVRVTNLRDKLISGIINAVPYVKLNGHPEKRLPGNVNFSFRFIEGESLLLNLDLKGVAATSGSACTSGTLDPSHVLLAMGMSHEVAHGSLRLTIGKYNTMHDVEYCLEVLPEIVIRLRQMSPLYEGI
ncbi:MAG: cysteine desulfurase NifS [Negativicutes bacterium]|jgi:cysteine desulfurase